MENQYKLLVGLILGIFLSISLVNAISLSSPNTADINQNINLKVSGFGFYCVEINIDQSFIIVSDVTQGNFEDGIYKSCYATDFEIALRPTKAGSYEFTGEYTQGFGVLNLNLVTIKINEKVVTLTCPICSINTVWSNCENNLQVRSIYLCSTETNYVCSQKLQSKSCQTQSSSGGSSSDSACEATWICKDDSNLAYQSSDCSLSSIQVCSEGCENKECKVKQETKDKFSEDDLTVEILPPSTQQTSQSFFAKAMELMKRFFDFLIFWD